MDSTKAYTKEIAHVLQLDGLRFFAVLMVMVAHWLQWQWGNPLMTSIPFGYGVTLFFVLSGFLITRILLSNRDKKKEQGASLWHLIKSFYSRRVLRIFPIYYLLIILLFVFNYQNTREIFPWLASYTTNIYQSLHNTSIGDFNHLWSLAVEEQFYLFWPFVILFIKPSRTLFVIIFTIVLALVTKWYLYQYIGNWMATSYFTLGCMHALGLGAVLSYIELYYKDLAYRLAQAKYLYLSALVYAVFRFLAHHFSIAIYLEVFDEFVFAIVACFLIVRAWHSKFSGLAKMLLTNRFVTYSGKISYGLYLYHLFIPSMYAYFRTYAGINIDNKYVEFILFYGVTFIIAHISWRLIELPINKLKMRFPYLGKIVQNNK